MKTLVVQNLSGKIGFSSQKHLILFEFKNRYQYSLYHRLLNRYLEHKYQNSEKAIEKVKKLTEILNEMNPVKDILEGLFIQSDANQLALVLNEVYNLS